MGTVFNRRLFRQKHPAAAGGGGAFAATWPVDSIGPITMGLPVAQGLIPAGKAVRVGAFTTQTDFLTTWPDGSMQFGLVHFNATSTGNQALTLIDSAGGSYTPVWPTASMAFAVTAGFGAGLTYTATLPIFDGSNTRANGAVARRSWVRVVPKTGGGVAHPYLDVIFELTCYAAGGHKVSIAWTSLHNVAGGKVTANITTTVAGVNIPRLTLAGFTTYLGQRWHAVTYTGMTEAVVHHDFETWIAANVIPRIPGTVDPKTYDMTDTNYQIGCGPKGGGGFYVGEAGINMGDSESRDRQELNQWTDWEARLFALNTETYRQVVLRHGDLNGCWSWAIDAAGDGLTPLTDLATCNTDYTAGIRGDSNLGWIDYGADASEGASWIGTFDGANSPGSAARVERQHLNEMNFIPYLLTGDKFYLDNLRFQGAWAVLASPFGYAEAEPNLWPGYFRGRNGVRGELNDLEMGRNLGRGIKKIARAAWACEDSDVTFRAWAKTIVQNNLEAVARLTDYLSTNGWGDGGSWAHFYPNYGAGGDTFRTNGITSTTGANPTELTLIGDDSGVGTGTNDHGMLSGDFMTLTGFSGGAAGLNGRRAVTRISALKVTVAVNTIGSPTTGVGAWSTPRGQVIPPWRICDGAREIAWIGFTGLWTMTASMWAFPDRVAQMMIALQDNPTFDTNPGPSYNFYPCTALISGVTYNHAGSWAEFVAMNTDAVTSALLESQATYTGYGSVQHRGCQSWTREGEDDRFYTVYAYNMINYGYLRGITGALAARVRLENAANVLPELKYRAGFYQKST